MNLPEESIRENLHDIDLGKNFMDMALKTQSTKTKIKLYQNKKLHSRGNNRHSKRQPTEWENIFANCISNQGLNLQNV